MLKNIPNIISPELLKILDEMGHGDEIVIGDSNFPATKNGQRVVRADGIGGVALLDAILSLIPLDPYVQENMFFMETVAGDPTPTIWPKYEETAKKHDKNVRLGTIERQAFYKRAAEAFCIVQSGETALYGNIVLKKGVL